LYIYNSEENAIANAVPWSFAKKIAALEAKTAPAVKSIRQPKVVIYGALMVESAVNTEPSA
jgi:hypothetical protein